MLQGRALEQALISWDVLARAEIADWEGDYIAALRANAERARDALPASGEVGVRADVSCDGIVAQLAPPETKRATVDDLLAAVGVHELAAYRELSVRSRSAVDELRTAGVLAQLRQYARLLSLAHLPTLATFYLQSASRCLASAMRATTWSRFCATLTHEISYRVTSFKSDGQPVQDELAVYATARTLISRGAPDTAFGLVGERCGGGKRPNPDALSDRMALSAPSSRRRLVSSVSQPNKSPRSRSPRRVEEQSTMTFGETSVAR